MWTLFLTCAALVFITYLSELNFFPNQIKILFSFLMISGFILTYFSFFNNKKSYIAKKISIVFNVFLVASICGVVNYLGFKNSKRYDLTSDKKNSISSYSQTLSKKLKSPLSITIISSQSTWSQSFEFLSLYKNSLDLKLRALDPDKDFIEVSKLKLSKQPAFIFEYENEKKILYSQLSEQNMAISLKRFVQPSSEKICWLQGHGELDPSEVSKDGANLVFKRLRDGGYQVHVIKSLDKSCTLSLILGPRLNFTPNELAFIKNNKTILAIDPSLSSSSLNGIRSVFIDDGIKIRNDVIVDAELSKNTGDATIIELVDNIHKDFDNSLDSKYTLSYTSSLELGENASPLFKTSSFPKSWSVKSFDEAASNIKYKKSDIKGPNVIAATAMKSNQPHVVVFGSSKFLKNSEVLKTQNSSLLLNSIDWLLGMKKMSFDRPEALNEVLSVNSNQLKRTIFVILIIIPLLFFLLSFYFYRRRL